MYDKIVKDTALELKKQGMENKKIIEQLIKLFGISPKVVTINRWLRDEVKNSGKFYYDKQ